MSDPGEQLASAFGRVLWLLGLLLLSVSVGLAWPMETVGGLFQILGIVVTALGVAVVPGWLAEFARWLQRSRSRLRAAVVAERIKLSEWWARQRGRPIVRQVGASDSIALHDSASAVLTRHRVDRSAVSDRDWLVHLDDRLYGLIEQIDERDKRDDAERARLDQRLTEQDRVLRAHTVAVATRGWQFIVAGLGCSLFGTALTLIG